MYRYSSIENAIMAKLEKYFPLFRYHDRWKNLKRSMIYWRQCSIYLDQLQQRVTAFEEQSGNCENKEYMKPTERTKKISKNKPSLC